MTAESLHPADLMRRTPLLVLLLLSLPLLGQGVWGERGATRAFAVNGDFLYTADGRGVSAYDTRGAISRIDVESDDDETFDIAMMGTGDVVVATNTGVERFAVAANGTLDRLSWIEMPSRVTKIAANATYAAAVSEKILTILERDGSEMKIARRITFTEPVNAIAFVGQYLYVSVAEQPLRVYLAPPSKTFELPHTSTKKR